MGFLTADWYKLMIDAYLTTSTSFHYLLPDNVVIATKSPFSPNDFIHILYSPA